MKPLRRYSPKAEHFTDSTVEVLPEVRSKETMLKTGALQNAILNSANFSSIATDEKGVIQIFNVGAEHMLGYAAADVLNKVTPADISDPQEVIARAKDLSLEFATTILPGFEALVYKASRGIEDIYELTYIRKDGSRFPAIVSVTALRDEGEGIIGYLLIGTDNSARKHAEEALLKAGALQSAIFNSATFSCIATDAKGVIQIFNVGAERMLGYTAAEVVNLITPADFHDSQEVIARAAALSLEFAMPIAVGFEALAFKASRGIEDIYELTKIRKDGSRFPAVISVTALRDGQDEIIGYLLIGNDNTARQQVEEERKRLDQRLRDQQFYTRSLIESSIDALMTTDPLGIIIDVNKQMEALTGCTRDELIGAPFKNYFTDSERAEAAIKLVLSEKRIINYELTARNRGGKAIVVSYNATTFYDRDRRLQGVFAAARDITEERRTEEALSASELRYRRLFETAKDGILILDADTGMVVDVNPFLITLLGFSREQFLGKAIWNLGFFKDIVANEDKFSELREKEYLRYENMPLETIDGRRIEVEFISNVYLVNGCKVIQCNVRDVSARRKAEAAVRQLYGELEQRVIQRTAELEAANKELEAFSYSVSHDLRAPLRAVDGFSQAVLEDFGPQLPEECRRRLEIIRYSTQRMGALIDDLLTFARLSRQALSKRVIDTGSLVRGTLDELGSPWTERQVEVHVGDLPASLGDPVLLKQVWVNLLSNALKYTSKRDKAVLEIGCIRTNDADTFFVRDNGTGFDMRYADKLFGVFQRLHRVEDYEGTGVGLAIVQRIVQRHNGRVWADASVDCGATFYFTLEKEAKP